MELEQKEVCETDKDENCGKAAGERRESIASTIEDDGEDNESLINASKSVMRKRIRILESELASLGVDVDEVKQKSRDEFVSESASPGAESRSTYSRLSHFDFAKMSQGVVREQTFVIKSQETVLKEVRRRRFTLEQERRLSRRLSDDFEEEKFDDDESLPESRRNTEPGAFPAKETDIATPRRRLAEALQFAEKQVPVTQLPRGGVYVQTSKGPIQFGIPPETIKDPMNLGLEVPKFYIVPRERFNLKLGINMCEVEFPAYFNFFIKQSCLHLVLTEEEEKLVRKVIDETLEGPSSKHLYVDHEYPKSSPNSGRYSFIGRPDHVKEINYFKEPRNGRRIATDTVVTFVNFKSTEDEEFFATLSETAREVALKAKDVPFVGITKDVRVAVLGNGLEIVDCLFEYILIDDGEVIAQLDDFLTSWVPLVPKTPGAIPEHIIEPPLFGVTVLGSSHGFDPQESTSGFVLWLHKQGIMVDPPPNATEHLLEAGIIPSMITGIILTHCHADHDAGAFQKILKENKISLITTQTIFESFIRKYSLISGFAENFLNQLFEPKIVKIGEDFNFCGSTLKFFYSLHALPCIGFEARVADKTFAYSADTFYDPEGINDLCARGYLSEARRDALLDFPWDCDVIFHEAGIPPIHTPLSALENLPDHVKEKLHIIHIAEDKAAGSFLKRAVSGVENTIRIETRDHEFEDPAAILRLLHTTDIFRHFTIAQASELLQLCTVQRYDAGEAVCRRGDVGEHFYIVLSGYCGVEFHSKEAEKGKDLHEGQLPGSKMGETIVLSRSSSMSLMQTKMLKGLGGSGRSLSGATSQQLMTLKNGRIYGPADYLGEMALLSETRTRSADIIALTELRLIKLEMHAFRYILDISPGLEHRLERLSQIRCSHSWKAIGSNSKLCGLSSTQRAQLQSTLNVAKFQAGTKLWTKGAPAPNAFLLASGQLEFLEMKDEQDLPFQCGAFFCNIASMMSLHQAKLQGIDISNIVQKNRPSQIATGRTTGTAINKTPSKKGSISIAGIVDSKVSLVAKTDVNLYVIEFEEILDFLDQNPGIFINLIDSVVME